MRKRCFAGTIRRTTDGGTTWERRPVTGADSTLEFRDVHALSAKVAWVLAAGPGAKSRIYHTRDGGATWQPWQSRVANPKGDRVKITMSGKFLPYKYYGNSGNVPEYGYREE